MASNSAAAIGAKVTVFIHIERVSAQRIHRCESYCTAPDCGAAATWVLVDRDMPDVHSASMGERHCCTAHITATYLSLRGAHIVAHAPPDAYTSYPYTDRRKRRKHASIASLSDVQVPGADRREAIG